MVIEYLENIYQELYAEKINLESQKQNKKIKFDENKKIIEALDYSVSDSLESFFPKKINLEDKDKINGLKREQIYLKDAVSQLENKIVSIDLRIKELDAVLSSARNEISKTRQSTETIQNCERNIWNLLAFCDQENRQIAMELYYSVMRKIENIVSRNQMICQTSGYEKGNVLDPSFVQNELNEIANHLANIMYKLNPFLSGFSTMDDFMEKELKPYFKKQDVTYSFSMEETGEREENIPNIVLKTVAIIIKDILIRITEKLTIKNMSLKLKYQQKSVEVYIEYQGRKIEDDPNITERIQLLNGTLTIEEHKNETIWIKIIAPYVTTYISP